MIRPAPPSRRPSSSRPNEGIAKIEQYASWLDQEWPGAAASLREGLAELFTINRLGLPSPLRRCLGTTNLIDNSHSALRERTRRVKHWQDGTMALDGRLPPSRPRPKTSAASWATNTSGCSKRPSMNRQKINNLPRR